MLIYDIEIKKAIKMRTEKKEENIEYCAGFDDHANMGVSCIAAYDYKHDRYRVFMDDNWNEFQYLLRNRDTIIGFNNINFDNQVIFAYNLIDDLKELEEKSYDILQEIWNAANGTTGIQRDFDFRVHAGYGLDQCIKANFDLPGKTGHGALAPIDYQRGNYGSLLDYCLADVWLTKMLFDQIREYGHMTNPKTQSGTLTFPMVRVSGVEKKED